LDSPLSVAIVGAGMSGLGTALALGRRGIRARVYEQAPVLTDVGAGVMLAPNGVRVLDRWGLGSQLRTMGASLGPGSFYHRHDGTVVAPFRTSATNEPPALFGMHRADLVAMLREQIPDDAVRLGARCIGIRQLSKSAELLFEDGTSDSAHIVIAADGIHSTIRPLVVDTSAPTDSRMIAYRGLVPASLLPDWPRNAAQLWMGHGKHFLVYPVRSGELLNYVGFAPAGDGLIESWSAVGDPDVLRAEFDGWDERVGHLLSQVTSTFWWGLYDREPLDTWVSNRITLAGDAAHPMLPHLGQGANQALEDAEALATLLSSADAESAPAALAWYDALRRPRTSVVQRSARSTGGTYDTRNGNTQERDAAVRSSGELRQWLFDYDVSADATASLQSLRAFKEA
jgi:salicylate hydroxylase